MALEGGEGERSFSVPVIGMGDLSMSSPPPHNLGLEG